MVKSEQLLQFQYHASLSDFELISASMYCRKLINRKDNSSLKEFNDLVFFFFDDNTETAIKTLQKIDKIYQDEYFKRHCN